MKTSALRAWGWVGALAMTVAIGCAKQAPPTIAWNTNYDAALADARKTGRPILLDFYTDW